VKVLNKAVLPALIAQSLLALAASSAALAQDQKCEQMEGTPPGLYTSTDEGHTFLFQEGKIVEMGPGESGYANEGEIKCITRPPEFLDWPCATDAAQSRKFATYTVEDLGPGNKMDEIVERYFQIPEVLEPIPNWIDGEYNAIFNYKDIIQFSSPDYWYHPDPKRPFLDPKRPRSLLIALFVGTQQAIIDNYAIDALRKDLGTDEIPVTFVFNDSNAVPITYFGDNVSLEEVYRAFIERNIKVAEPPIWWLGDYTLEVTIEEMEKFFDIPALDDIDAKKRAEIEAELKEQGFTRKPFLVNIFSESQTMALDQPERVRVAASMGMPRVPVVVTFIEPDSIVARCGPGTPVGSSGVTGQSTPQGGAVVPPGAPVPPVEPVPPAPAPPASDS